MGCQFYGTKAGHDSSVYCIMYFNMSKLHLLKANDSHPWVAVGNCLASHGKKNIQKEGQTGLWGTQSTFK